MVTEWIPRHRVWFAGQSTLMPEWAGITSSYVLDVSSVKNVSHGVNAVHKLPSNASSAVSGTDSGTWIIFLYSVIFLLAVIGNLLVILTLIQSRRMRTITNLFLLNLAVSDLFLGVFCMPFTLVGALLRDFIFGELMCKLLPYLQGAKNCSPKSNKLRQMIAAHSVS